MAAPIKWSPEEFDIVARAALAAGAATRVDMLREGQKALPRDRQKVIPDHLGGKSWNPMQLALERVKAKGNLTAKQATAAHARNRMAQLRKSLVGQGIRMAEAMKKANKSDIDVATATGVHLHSIRVVLRDKTKTMMDRNVAKIATYLGCNYGWLRAGVDAEMPVQFTVDPIADKPAELQVMPPKASMFKANGKHAPRVEVAMQQNVDSTITSLWSLLPMDAKLMVIARVSELVAMRVRGGT